MGSQGNAAPSERRFLANPFSRFALTPCELLGVQLALIAAVALALGINSVHAQTAADPFPSKPVRTPAELVAYGKANPKALTFAVGNRSSLIMGEMFSRSTGMEMLHVPYTSNPAGSPAPVVAKMATEVQKLMSMPVFQRNPPS